MKKGLSSAQWGGIVAAALIVVAGAGMAANLGGRGGELAPPAEVSVNVDCDGIAAARTAVDAELEAKKEHAKAVLDNAMEAASDAYWERRRAHEDVLNQCMSNANLADPCKEAFENQSAVMQGAIADPAAERVPEWDAKIKEAKDTYNDCLENPPEENTTEGMRERCQEAFDAADQEALDARKTAEETAQAAHDQAVSDATAAYVNKHGALNALEEECKKAAEEPEEPIGSVGGGGSLIPETDAQPDNVACTGSFAPSNPDKQKEIDKLKRQRSTEQSLQRQEQLGGEITEGGLGGAGSRAARINELSQDITALEQEIAAGGAVCNTDADCGDPTPVCCSDFEVGKVKCEKGLIAGLFGGSGTCVNETTICEDDEVCAGKPAQCVEVPTQTVEAIAYGGTHIPISYLKRVTGQECDEEEHWHLAGGQAVGVNGAEFSDPDRNGCGFGKTSAVPVVEVEVPAGQLEIRVNMGGL